MRVCTKTNIKKVTRNIYEGVSTNKNIKKESTRRKYVQRRYQGHQNARASNQVHSKTKRGSLRHSYNKLRGCYKRSSIKGIWNS